MKIGTRDIGPDRPVYIIAELGVNHDGSVERALELTRAAAAAGADAVKLQYFETDRLMSKSAKLAAYQKAAGETDPIAMLRRLELSIEQMEPVVSLAHAMGLHAIVTVFSTELVDAAERLAWDAYKTASPDIVHRPLLQRLVGTGKPLIVSTGASTMEEVERTIGWMREWGAVERTALMQCVSCYPTREEDAELGGMAALGEVFEGVVGYSDHTPGEATGAAAVEAGACVLEKHLTYSRAAKGPDHGASLEAAGMRRYVEMARATVAPPGLVGLGATNRGLTPTARDWRPSGAGAAGDAAVGGAVKRVLACEQDVRAASRQSLVANRSLRAGETFAAADVGIKRPGTGLLPYRLPDVIGRQVARAIEADTTVGEEDIRW